MLLSECRTPLRGLLFGFGLIWALKTLCLKSVDSRRISIKKITKVVNHKYIIEECLKAQPEWALTSKTWHSQRYTYTYLSPSNLLLRKSSYWHCFWMDGVDNTRCFMSHTRTFEYKEEESVSFCTNNNDSMLLRGNIQQLWFCEQLHGRTAIKWKRQR